MSHVSHIQLMIFDLAAIRRACSRMGLEFVENQKTYAWYGTLVEPDKYPLPEGITTEQLGHCDHAIKIPGARYEIGVLKHNGSYMLVCDFWDSSLKRAIGENGGLLKQAYGVEVIKEAARKKRFSYSEKQVNSGIEITITL
ncbi:MAG: DUF1257 domain-containing protein [Desulfovibrio sp.]|nr:DUF1257 domain-containing protein [Desulfovibrio sp.]